MGPLGFPELIIIFFVALIVFGPRKLPELGRSLGKGLSEFKRASNDLRNTLDHEIREEERRPPPAPPSTILPPQPAAAATAGSTDFGPEPDTVARGTASAFDEPASDDRPVAERTDVS
jgi:sec-independent protein translocase protein TatA